VNDFERLHVEALLKCLGSIEETIARLNAITMQAARDGLWDQVRDEVSCLDSIGDVTRQALDVLEGRGSDLRNAGVTNRPSVT